MREEFQEQDLDTPTEADLDLVYGSKYLSATDIGDRKIKTKIANIKKEELRDGDGDRKKLKFVLYFETLDKPLILNATNKDTLVDKLGRIPANWKGADVGVFVDSNVMYAGKRVKGIRLRVLQPPAAKAPAAKTPSPAATPWPQEASDPGPSFDPDLNDAVPDFTPAE